MTTSASTAAAKRRAPARRTKRRANGRIASRSLSRIRIRSLRGRVLIVIGVLGTLAIGYFAWFRDSSLVAVHDVKVEGVSSSDRGPIAAALTHAGKQMTTLHVQTDRLSSAVRDFPSVASVTAHASFPHGLTIDVAERQPVLVATDGHHRMPVAADGTILPGLQVNGSLPELRVDALSGSGKLSGQPLAEALVIGSAPAPLRPLISNAVVSPDYGVVVTMRGGIEVRFGTSGGRKAKWAAAAAVLADPGLSSLTYLDVRAPQRPAAGGTSTPSPATTAVTPSSTPTTITP